MAELFSTMNVHPRERVSYWLEVATKTFVAHEFSSKVGQGFVGNLRVGHIGHLAVASYDVDACEVRRLGRHIRPSDDTDVFLQLQVSGQMRFFQEGREALLRAGDLAVIDTKRPYSLTIPERSCAIVIKAGRRELEARLGNITTYAGAMIERLDPVGSLALGFLRMLPERVDALDGATGLKVADSALDLTALALSSSAQNQGALAVSSVKAVALARVKATIESRLSDPQLKPEMAAAAAGISVRYANALLATENTSLERYILDRRLERCRRALEDQVQAHRTAGEIAFSWGFADVSHFGRRFKARYGVSPTEYRRRHPEFS